MDERMETLKRSYQGHLAAWQKLEQGYRELADLTGGDAEHRVKARQARAECAFFEKKLAQLETGAERVE